MAARWYYESAPDVWTEITDRIGREDWEVREQAEEGSAAMSTLVIDDPDMDFDIVGRTIIYCAEDTSEADDDRLFGGIVADQEIGREGGEWLQPLSRIWTVSVTDLNSNWQRRVMVGADCNRPAETDVERVQWLMTGTETNWATDRTTYISTATPIAMDACDYRGQMCAQVMDDCAQASGKNWFTWLLRDGVGDPQIAVWYGRDSLAVYDSPLFLSNDPNDWTDAEIEAGTSLVWPISMDTKLRRDPSRVYSGVYLPYDGGAVYRMDQDTIDEYSPWDFVAPSANVKTSTKAIARATRYLAELDEQDEVITTSVELPAAKATMIRAGMRLQFRATHLPGYGEVDTWSWLRVLSCAVTPIAHGDRYRLTLELQGPGTASYPQVFAGIIRSENYTDALGYAFTMEQGSAPEGWDVQNVVGPISIDQSSAPYTSMTVSEDVVVRIWAIAQASGVSSPGEQITLAVKINGATVATDTDTAPGGYFATTLEIDLRDYSLSSGDVVSVSDPIGSGWTNFGNNLTFLRVGRGTFNWEFGSFVGP